MSAVDIMMRWFHPKKLTHPDLSPPAYVGRYTGRPFLVLGSGPNLIVHADKVWTFLRKKPAVILAANLAFRYYPAHYIAFTNRKSLAKYGREAALSGSRLLLGCYFPRLVIREAGIPDGTWEYVPYVNDQEAPFGIRDGVILSGCGGSGVLLLAVAAVMGAKEIWAAGFDGYREGEADHFYDEPDITPEQRVTHGAWQRRALIGIHKWCLTNGVDGPRTITPTEYWGLFRCD